VEKRPYPPGEHGRGRLKESEYNLQLREKQKARRIYGVLEKQFHNYYVEAARRKGITGETLLQLLETRLDNVVYRGGLARSRDQARQLVRHSHVTVNGRKVNIPSYQVKPGDVVQVKERMRQNLNVHESIQLQTGRPQPGWLELNAGEAKLTVTAVPSREQVEGPIQEQLIVELYSK
jgi:small subunit ribosomal protein S4